MGANYSEIQELLQQRADCQAHAFVLRGDPLEHGMLLQHLGGASRQELAEKFFLSEKSIGRIIYKERKDRDRE